MRCEFHGKTTPLRAEAFVLQGDWVKCLRLGRGLISRAGDGEGEPGGRGIDYARRPR